MKYTYISNLLLLITGASTIFAQSYFPLYPNELSGYSAQLIGSAGTGIASNPGVSCIWGNPAMLGSINGRFNSSFTFGVQRSEEFRSVNMIDSFDDVVTKSAYASNRNFYTLTHGGMVTSLPSVFDKINVGIGVMPYWDYRYNYSEEVRGNLSSGNYNRDPLVGYHTIERSGKIYATGIGTALNIVPALDLGLSVSWLQSFNLMSRQGIISSDSNIDDALAGEPYSVGGDITLSKSALLVNAGVLLRLSEMDHIGFMYRSGVSLTLNGLPWYPSLAPESQLPTTYVNMDTTFAHTITMPPEIGIGVQHKVGHSIYPTTINVEVRYRDWTLYEYAFNPMIDSLSTLDYPFESTFDVRSSVEYLVRNRYPVRFGFIYKGSPMGSDFETTTITLGTSHVFGPMTLDVGGWFNYMSYIYDDIFIASGYTGEPAKETVQEWNSQLVMTLTYSF